MTTERRGTGAIRCCASTSEIRQTSEHAALWEYMTFDMVKRKNEIEELNRLGRKGWEAVAMVSSWGVGWRFVHPTVLLKRLRPDEAEGSPG